MAAGQVVMTFIHKQIFSFILANTEELHTKIAEMSDRIQQLEDAVASLSSDPHPLLHPDLLRIKSSAELHRAQMTAGTKSTPSPPEEHTDGEPAIPSALPQEHLASDVSATLARKFRTTTNSVTLFRQRHYSSQAHLIYLQILLH